MVRIGAGTGEVVIQEAVAGMIGVVSKMEMVVMKHIVVGFDLTTRLRNVAALRSGLLGSARTFQPPRAVVSTDKGVLPSG